MKENRLLAVSKHGGNRGVDHGDGTHLYSAGSAPRCPADEHECDHDEVAGGPQRLEGNRIETGGPQSNRLKERGEVLGGEPIVPQ